MKPRVFLDTGIFAAMLDRSDRWHVTARGLFRSAQVQWSTSLLVVSEAHSWFLHRHGEDTARAFQQFLMALPALQLFDVQVALHRKTLKVLDELRGSKLTYVDASSLAILDQHRIEQVWGTDHHLGLTGAAVTPGGR